MNGRVYTLACCFGDWKVFFYSMVLLFNGDVKMSPATRQNETVHLVPTRRAVRWFFFCCLAQDLGGFAERSRLERLGSRVRLFPKHQGTWTDEATMHMQHEVFASQVKTILAPVLAWFLYRLCLVFSQNPKQLILVPKTLFIKLNVAMGFHRQRTEFGKSVTIELFTSIFRHGNDVFHGPTERVEILGVAGCRPVTTLPKEDLSSRVETVTDLL